MQHVFAAVGWMLVVFLEELEATTVSKTLSNNYHFHHLEIVTVHFLILALTYTIFVGFTLFSAVNGFLLNRDINTESQRMKDDSHLVVAASTVAACGAGTLFVVEAFLGFFMGGCRRSRLQMDSGGAYYQHLSSGMSINR